MATPVPADTLKTYMATCVRDMRMAVQPVVAAALAELPATTENPKLFEAAVVAKALALVAMEECLVRGIQPTLVVEAIRATAIEFASIAPRLKKKRGI